MPYQLQLTVSNPDAEPVKTVIYGGTVFEGIDPFSNYQNLSTVETTTFTVPPEVTNVVVIDT
jgi:hypothetical protein